MNQPTPRPLVDADLLVWAVVLGYRAQQQRAGLHLLLMPFPLCPTCCLDVHAVNQVTVDRGLGGESRLTMQPCGHGHTASDDDVLRLRDHIGDMLEALERDDHSRDPNVHGWSTADVIREARDRVGGPEASDPTQCSGDEGFCPEHGYHRHSLKQPGDDAQIASGGQLRQQVQAAIESEVYEYRERTMFWPETGGVTQEIARLAARGAMKALAANCTHSFPDPYPAPLDQIGDCRHCGTSYQAAKRDHDGPSVRECAAADERCWPLEKHGE